jgi:hypothetical protein
VGHVSADAGPTNNSGASAPKNLDALAISALAAGRVFVPARKPAMAASFQWIAKMRTLGHLGFMCLMNFLLVFQYEICILLQ